MSPRKRFRSNLGGKPALLSGNWAEWWLLALVMATAIATRIVRSDATSVEHFDEGVYASNIWFGAEDDFQYPQRHLYAPPLLPWVVEWTMILTGQVTGHVAMYPSLFAGSLTIAVVWWLARSVTSSRGALFAASLAASSGLHILLSRSALTDAGMLFWLVLAIGLFERAGRRLSWSSFACAGGAVCLAWWTKYNGWLPLLIGIVSFCLRMAIDALVGHEAARDSNCRKRWIAGWALSVVVAFLGWSPFLISLQSVGGYSSVAANHRQYLVGLHGWWSSLMRQVANLGYAGGWWNLDLFCLAAGGIGAGLVIVRLCKPRQDATSIEKLCLVVTWYLVLAAMTPLYTPYPRLLLPWLAAAWILGGATLDLFLDWLANRTRIAVSDRTRPAWLSASLIVAILVVSVVTQQMAGRVRADRRGIEQIARRIRDSVSSQNAVGSPNSPTVIYVFGEPALFFQLHVAGVSPVVPVQTVQLDPARTSSGFIPTFLVVGPHALRDRQFQAAWPMEQSRYQLVETYSFVPSPLVLLDNYAPRDLSAGPIREEFRLYRIP